jgi:hypothetical protein
MLTFLSASNAKNCKSRISSLMEPARAAPLRKHDAGRGMYGRVRRSGVRSGCGRTVAQRPPRPLRETGGYREFS